MEQVWYATDCILCFCTPISNLCWGSKSKSMIFQTFVLGKKIFQKCKAEKAQIVKLLDHIIRKYSCNLKKNLNTHRNHLQF